MEPQNTPAKRDNNGSKIVAVLTVGAVFYYFFTRSNIAVCEYDTLTRSVKYKINLGFKTIEGQISALNPSSQEHIFFNKILTIATNTHDTIIFTITNTKGEVVDQVVHKFIDLVSNQPINTCIK